jgi:molecular chaperone DnaJ
MARERSYYEILGLERNASQEDIKKKYRSLALKFHPDRMVGKPEAEKKETEKKFQEITNAYETLSNEKSRKKYDSEREGFTGFGFDGNSEGFGDSFENIFESFFTGTSSRNRHFSKSDVDSPRKGEDILFSISVSFKEFVLGTEKSFNLDFLKACPKCSQTGADSESDIRTCYSCNGKGFIEVIRRSLFGNIETKTSCPTCKGKGKIISKKCSLCKATKFVNEKRIFKIEIPRGIKPGERIVKKSSGNDGIYSSEKGDVHFEVNVKNHSYFSIKGNDIHINLPVSFINMIIGDIIKVITVEGLEEIKIPQCSQFGDHVIIRNKGLYTKVNGQTRGDFYVWLQVRLPKRISVETEIILKKMQNNTEWKPNEDFIEKNKNILSEK